MHKSKISQCTMVYTNSHVNTPIARLQCSLWLSYSINSNRAKVRKFLRVRLQKDMIINVSTQMSSLTGVNYCSPERDCFKICPKKSLNTDYVELQRSVKGKSGFCLCKQQPIPDSVSLFFKTSSTDLSRIPTMVLSQGHGGGKYSKYMKIATSTLLWCHCLNSLKWNVRNIYQDTKCIQINPSDYR